MNHYHDHRNSFSELKLLSKYAGELRYGPAFLHLKTEPKNVNEKYLIRNAQSKIINKSENLENLIKKIMWKKFKLVN